MKPTFADVEPFRFAVFDDFMPAALLYAASVEFDAVPADAWVRYDSADERGKRTCNRLDAMGPECRSVLAILAGQGFAEAIGRQMGFDGLQSDPTLHGGGLHVTEPGGRLGTHSDSEIHPSTKLMRRANVVLYCSGWESGWGGELELFDGSGKRCVHRIEPRFNRAVIFECGRSHFHGHATVTGPMQRRSFAAFFWSPPQARARFISAAGEPFDAAREAARIERSR